MKLTSVYILIAAMMLSSCFQEEDPLSLPPLPEESISYTFEMGPDYLYQYYFDLGTGTVVGNNEKTVWDLAFDCRQDMYYVWLNSSKTMLAANTGSNEFEMNIDLSVLDWKIDHPGGDPDSNAIGDWGDLSKNQPVSYGMVYVLDLGMNEQGNHLGYRKLQMKDCTNDRYAVRVAELDGGSEQTVHISRDPLMNMKHLSLSTYEEIDIEPVRTDWDLLFTRYTTPFYIPMFTPYQVSGVLGNPNHTEVAETMMEFEAITIVDAQGMEFSNDWDVIGYDWKEVDIQSGSYVVFPGHVFIVKDNSSSYYKLRFLDFVNSAGENGFPRIEYQKL